MSQFAATLQVFFTDRLIRQRQASPHTIASYRDTRNGEKQIGRAYGAPRQPSTLPGGSTHCPSSDTVDIGC